MTPKPRKRGYIYDLRKNKAIYMLAIPGILFFIIFSYIPMAGVIIAFKDYNVIDGIFNSPFIGLKNFEFLVRSNDFFRITYNTLFLNALFIVFGVGTQVGIAIMINEVRNKYFKKISQTVLLLPYFISWVIVGVISNYLFGTDSGFINTMLKTLGLEPVRWFNNAGYWPSILTFSYIWKWVGYGSVIYLSAIVGVDQEIYESAQLDGCNRWQLIRHITLPCIMPTITIMVLLAIGRIFYGDFGMIFNMVKNNSMLFSTTDIIDTYVFRAVRGQTPGSLGMASAAGFLQSALGFITILVANKIVSSFNKSSALF